MPPISNRVNCYHMFAVALTSGFELLRGSVVFKSRPGARHEFK